MSDVPLIERIKYQLFFLMKIPLIFFARPKIITLNKEQVQILIPFSRRSKNHINSMYFGALLIGADLAAGLMAMTQTTGRKQKVVPVFKSVKGDFLKRVEGDALFTCDAGEQAKEMIEECINTGERVTQDIPIYVTSPGQGDEILATFTLALSVKVKK